MTRKHSHSGSIVRLDIRDLDLEREATIVDPADDLIITIHPKDVKIYTMNITRMVQSWLGRGSLTEAKGGNRRDYES